MDKEITYNEWVNNLERAIKKAIKLLKIEKIKQ